MLIKNKGRGRPRILCCRGRRLYFKGTKPEKLDRFVIREKLEKALPQFRGASLHRLVDEYWASGEFFDNLHVIFEYYP